MEEKQKKAIDVLYNVFTDHYENWIRRRRLRKQFLEESAYKSQFFALWAMNDFYVLINRIQPSAFVSQTLYENALNQTSYLDAQMFLFDKSKALLISNPDRSSVPRNLNQSFQSNLTAKTKKSDIQKPNKTKNYDQQTIENLNEEKLFSDLSVKDTCDLFSKIMCAHDLSNEINQKEDKKSNIHEDDLDDSSQYGQVSSSDFIEIATVIFAKFKYAIVIAHRGKQWTQLQNVCKLMFNCINTFLVRLPPVTHNNRRMHKINDIWKSLLPCIYIAAENLLDMVFYATPIEVHNYILQRFYLV